ncbi:hypothetical protein AeMF1_011820 [Aphanomyces euteiches]|nr:hypothetical protein AeMF1_011820 [Aphanomyces euteiches]
MTAWIDRFRTEKQKLNGLLVANGGVAIVILLNSLFLLGQSGGVIDFLSCAVFIASALAGLVMLNRNPSAFSIGAVLGGSIGLVVLAFFNTLFWIMTAASIETHQVAAWFAATFNLIYCGIECLFLHVLYKARHNIIETHAAYATIPDAAPVGAVQTGEATDETSSVYSYQSSSYPPPPSADI